jgi:hypothetical protein
MNASLGAMMQDIVREVSSVARNMAIAIVVVGLSIMMSRMLRGFVQRRTTFRELPIVGQTLMLNSISFFIGILACTAILGLWRRESA